MAHATHDDVLDVVLAYIGFLHDRLVTRAPGITTITVRRAEASGGFTQVLTSERADLDGRFSEVSIRLEESDPPAPRDASRVFEFTRQGSVEGSVVLAMPDDVELSAEAENRLRMYALIMVSGLRVDLGEDWLTCLPVGRQATQTRDAALASHLERVAGYAHVIVRALTEPLDLPPDFAEAVFRYAPLHDIGQVVLTKRFLSKPGRLDDAEWETMKSHTVRGLAIVDDFLVTSGEEEWPRPDVLRTIDELHHETLDGKGYPHGLRGDDVPLAARVLTVADVFDALTSRRDYKPGWSVDEALAEMDRMVLAGKLDGRCMTALVTQPEVLESVVVSGSQPPEVRW